MSHDEKEVARLLRSVLRRLDLLETEDNTLAINELRGLIYEILSIVH